MKNKSKLKINPMTLSVIIISVLVLIIGSLAIGFLPTFLLVCLLDGVYFRKELLIVLKKIKAKISKKKEKIKKVEEKEPELIEEVKDEEKFTKIEIKEEVEVDEMKKGKKTKEKKKRHIGLRIFQCFLIFCCICFMVGICGVIAFCSYIVKTAPEFNPEELYSTEPSILYYRDGTEMVRLGMEKRNIITYDQIPEVYINALVATEDANFFQHNGVDIKRFLVASIKQLLGDRSAGGASTLTMQLSKNNYTSTEAKGLEGIIRKFQDIYVSVFKIETTYTKEEILEFYINSNQVGSTYGIEAAAQMYFGKSAKDINVAEAALLAGMYKAPSAYNPFLHPEAAEERRQTVLYLMRRHGYITDKEYEIAKRMTVDKIVTGDGSVNNGSDEMDDEIRSAVDTVVDEVVELTGKNPRVSSMKIYTTIDKKLQYHVGKIMTGEKYKWENKKVQAGIAVIDVDNGGLVAIGGNRNNSKDGNLNWATYYDKSAPEKTLRQIGSTAKPLYDYGPAIEYLNWSTGTAISDEKGVTYSDGVSINNWDGKFRGYDTIREQLKLSRNIPALKTFQKLDKSKILTFVKNLGLHPEANLYEPHAIGGYNGETPYFMAAAYAAFANGGYYTEPHSVTKIVDEVTGTTINNQKEKKQVMSSSTAYMITSILQDAAAYGIDSGKYKNINGVPYAGKTGTTNFTPEIKKQYKLPNNAIRDYWVMGYNTDYAIGLWYGYGSVADGYNKLSSMQHTRLFQAVAKGIFTNKADWKMPDTVKKVKIETGTATLMLPSEYTPKKYIKEELFVAGTEPTTVSTRFAKLTDVTNLQATSMPDGTISLTWDPIPTPDAFNEEVIKKLNKSAFSTTSALNSYVKKVIKENTSTLGNLGYNVYVKTDAGLTLLGWTQNSSYTVTGQYGNVTLVVKSCYSKLKTNMSDGVSVSATGTGSPIVPEPPEDNSTEETPIVP